MTQSSSPRRQQIRSILLRLLAFAIGLCGLPFIGEGLENVISHGLQLWSVECFGMALIPGVIAYGLWQRKRWAYLVVLWGSALAIPLLPILAIWLAIVAGQAGVAAMMFAVPSSLLASGIVFFLTRTETKVLFGSPSNASVEEDRTNNGDGKNSGA